VQIHIQAEWKAPSALHIWALPIRKIIDWRKEELYSLMPSEPQNRKRALRAKNSIKKKYLKTA
ncbi:MAG: hypothetical protein K2N55_07520, partial [Lachnospiraceae bacterium]|nr:hypothetical protein [Lachnospiraceae bacterium]